MDKYVVLQWLLNDAEARSGAMADMAERIPVKPVIKSLDGLHKSFSKHYVQKNGKYHLDTVEHGSGKPYPDKPGFMYAYTRIMLDMQLAEMGKKYEMLLPNNDIPIEPDKLTGYLREHFNDDVTCISFVLHVMHPDKYVFYPVSSIENELFDGFEFLADVTPEFEFDFDKIGRKGVDRYLTLNSKLCEFSDYFWPDVGGHVRQNRLHMLLFGNGGIAYLFMERSDYKRYWIMGTKKEYFKSLDAEDETEWSASKEVVEGDLVFMYRMSPRKAITDVFVATSDAWFNPYGQWEFWVSLRRLCTIPDFSFSEMRADPVMSSWGTVRKQFQGTKCEMVPHAVYNRLLESIPELIRQDNSLKLEDITPAEHSGEYASEEEFEDHMIVPLMKKWGFRYRRQYPCSFNMGSQKYRGRIDFYLYNKNGPLTLIENKLRVANEKELGAATEQAKSYALMLGMPRFVVASPEGLWFYDLSLNTESLKLKVEWPDLKARELVVRKCLEGI